MQATPLTPDLFSAVFDPRDPLSNKGSFGSVGVLGGAPGMTGAAVLAARAALKTGAGRVYVGLAQDPLAASINGLSLDSVQPELMWRPCQSLIEMADQIQAWSTGCGLGSDAYGLNALKHVFLLRKTSPMVVDADALNALATGHVAPVWGRAPVVMTPHPAEAARLLNCDVATIQSDRIQHAHTLAQRYQAWVVLKGHQTVICSPHADCWINTTGNVGLASAGTGDVLSGVMASLLAQGFSETHSVLAAVWLHGKAADHCVAQGLGPIGLTASEVIEAVRWVRNHTRHP